MQYLKKAIRTVKENSPILFGIVMIHVIFAIISIFGLFIDERTLMGVNVWIKPLKFAISTGIYIFTVGYFTTLMPYSRLKRNILNNIVSWTLLIEVGIIVVQGARGVQSHYNQSSVLDAILFASMGLLIAINVLVMVLFIIDSIRLKMNIEKTTQLALVFGWIIMVVGSWVGSKMIGQLGHNVGVADGGEGLPLVNWSTIAGDLRVAHFFGMHGLQIIPIFAFALYKKSKMTLTKRFILVTMFALLYAFLIGFVYYQAKQGKPFISF